MADYTYENLSVAARHVPDPSGGPFQNMAEAAAAGHDVINPVTGTFEVGVIIEGAFVPLISEKASLVFDRIDLAKQQQQQQDAQQAQTQAQADTGPQSASVPQQQQQG